MQWSLTIDGLVERPLTLRFDDLMRYPKTEVTSFHQCAGSPLAPFEPTRRICNIRWGGVRLADVLADCRPSAHAKYIWSYGADFGEFGGVTVDAYVKDLPIDAGRGGCVDRLRDERRCAARRAWLSGSPRRARASTAPTASNGSRG